ncbi:hypothetical protein EYZ11_007145 [Aspergillus tanneri]|uniref:Aminoglycoside phosphotransferase domain-containing protein n=1 Tax=Aspergillus tanneri TaxID=1220188 RepID=A0A4S3JG34_9EURO|nr:uncharacterized protein ATNIH1004_010655 [Aspergillus tanneri]KAA8641716.1 hypothetical protein ATNIH1004_010655 [Aspergillus tanneri]THC93388.1 hypothetical protein EYZ11_007145 [Aspergillus tanneri]
MSETMVGSTTLMPQGIPDDLIPIFKKLRDTPFACSDIADVPGQHVNSTFFATLSKPLPDGSKSVLFKHTKGWDAPWLGIAIDAARCFTEHDVHSKGICPIINENGFVIRPPRLLHFIPEYSTQIIENLENTVTLPEYLRSSDAISPSFATSLGRAVGSWLALFHHRNSEENGSGPAATRREKIPDRELYFNLYRGTLETQIRMSPQLFEGYEEAIRQRVQEGLKKDIQGRMGLIHGDLGARHFLIRNDVPIPNQDTILTPIDWETVHFGCQNQDFGQLIGELILVGQTDDQAFSDQVLQGLARGYQSLDEDSMFHVVFYAGLHLLMVLLTEGEPNTPMQNKMVGFARDCIVKGSQHDRQWLETTSLKYLLVASQ